MNEKPRAVQVYDGDGGDEYSLAVEITSLIINAKPSDYDLTTSNNLFQKVRRFLDVHVDDKTDPEALIAEARSLTDDQLGLAHEEYKRRNRCWDCQGQGTLPGGRDCSTCDGSGGQPDNVCRMCYGSGKDDYTGDPCPRCLGEREISTVKKTAEELYIASATRKSSLDKMRGLLNLKEVCNRCQGTGEIVNSDGEGKLCFRCNGTKVEP